MSRITGGLTYLIWLAWQVVTLAVSLGRDVLTPGLAITPRIVKLPLRASTDLEVAVLASSISMTPGTLVVGIAPATQNQPRALFVQALYGEDEEQVMADLRDMERRMLRMTRGRPS